MLIWYAWPFEDGDGDSDDNDAGDIVDDDDDNDDDDDDDSAGWWWEESQKHQTWKQSISVKSEKDWGWISKIVIMKMLIVMIMMSVMLMVMNLFPLESWPIASTDMLFRCEPLWNLQLLATLTRQDRGSCSWRFFSLCTIK